MTKSGYISSSAKLLMWLSGLLLFCNVLVMAGGLTTPVVAQFATKLSGFSIYVVLFVGFAALNGEGIGHKRAKMRKKRAVTIRLQFLLIFCYLLRYIKSAPHLYALSLSAESAWGIVFRLFMSVVSVVGSFGFLMTMVSLWYILRDEGETKLLPIEVASFGVGVIYNIYKLMSFAVVDYKLTFMGELFVSVFSNSLVSHILCICQYAVNILMFALVYRYYRLKSVQEAEQVKNAPKPLQARNV